MNIIGWSELHKFWASLRKNIDYFWQSVDATLEGVYVAK